jgi:hypothetical protein
MESEQKENSYRKKECLHCRKLHLLNIARYKNQQFNKNAYEMAKRSRFYTSKRVCERKGEQTKLSK